MTDGGVRKIRVTNSVAQTLADVCIDIRHEQGLGIFHSSLLVSSSRLIWMEGRYATGGTLRMHVTGRLFFLRPTLHQINVFES